MGNFTRELRTGWRNLLAAILGLALGIQAYTALSSLFLHAVESEFSWSRVVTAGALIALPITALVLPVIGWLTDRLGVRVIAACSTVALAASYFWLSHLSGKVGEYYIALIALYVLGCGTGPVTYTRLVAAHFVTSRGTALAIALCGISFFAVIMPPTIGYVLDHQGWRNGYMLLACTTLLSGLLAQLIMRPSLNVNREVEASGMNVRTVVGTRHFWILGGAIMLVSMASYGLVAQFHPVMDDMGLARQSTTFLMSIAAVSVMLSRLVVGRLLDQQYPARWTALVISISAIGPLVLLNSNASFLVMAVAVILIALSVGAELDLMSYFCARLFGMRHYAAIYGLVSVFFYLGTAIGGVAYGAIRDSLGSFSVALCLSTILLLGAGYLFLMLHQPVRDAPLSPAAT